jgi:predicted O-linked N-acetylglucosamine transferase (SPINDLY family)
MGRPAEAEKALRTALALRPGYAEALNNLGIVLHQAGDWPGAESCFRQALDRMPNASGLRSNLALTLASMGAVEEAERLARAASVSDPANAVTRSNLGLILVQLGRAQEAEQEFHAAADLDSSSIKAVSHWVLATQNLCSWSARASEQSMELRKAAAEGNSSSIQPFIVMSQPGLTPNELLRATKQFVAAEFASFLQRPPLTHVAQKRSESKLRVGYLSSDFHAHATSQLIAGVLERHNRSRFEVIGYSYGSDDASPMRARVVAAFDRFVDIRESSHEAAARKIAADGVDLLIDLKGYTSGARTQILALRPAPVQVNWLGYPGTLGSTRLADYLVGDPVVSPLERASDFAEVLALLPDCYQPNDASRPVKRSLKRVEVGLPEGAFVFCNFNQCYKITADVMDLWCRLLHAVPSSVFWLLKPSERACANLRREAQARGIAGDRLLFGPPMRIEDHLDRLRFADLGIDTFPVTSHTSASDLLWAGVPLVTRIGATFVSRVAASVLRACRLPELVTNDHEACFEVANELATVPSRLAALKGRIALNRRTSPLFDCDRFTRNLEWLFERMWDAHRSGNVRHIVCPQQLR